MIQNAPINPTIVPKPIAASKIIVLSFHVGSSLGVHLAGGFRVAGFFFGSGEGGAGFVNCHVQL